MVNLEYLNNAVDFFGGLKVLNVIGLSMPIYFMEKLIDIFKDSLIYSSLDSLITLLS